MKNHEMIDGKLLQTNKKYSQLKQKQKDKIAVWMYEETRKYYERTGKYPIEHHDDGLWMMQLCQRVYNLIDDIRAEDRTYLLVTHNGISRVVQSYFYDIMNFVHDRHSPLAKCMQACIWRATSVTMATYFCGHGMTNEEFAAFGIGNCEVRTYIW